MPNLLPAPPIDQCRQGLKQAPVPHVQHIAAFSVVYAVQLSACMPREDPSQCASCLLVEPQIMPLVVSKPQGCDATPLLVPLNASGFVATGKGREGPVFNPFNTTNTLYVDTLLGLKLLGRVLKRPLLWWWADLELKPFPYNLQGKSIWLLRHGQAGGFVGAMTAGNNMTVVHREGVPFLAQFEMFCSHFPIQCGTYEIQDG